MKIDLEKELLEFKNAVNKFKGKSSMKKFVLERLEKSFELYRQSVQEEYNFLIARDPRISINKLSGGK